jgi:lipid II:glycine glycyltransferase (peptidoglycan interpeptide bridge formation enzyme)
MVRKAQKNGVLVEKLDNLGLEDYFQLMTETYQRAGLEIKPKNYYSKVLEAYAPNRKAVVLLAKIHSNIISGVILLRNRHMCHYWLGANKKKEGNLGQGELLQWEAIKWAKENGSKYYDLCVVEHERLPQIARFKLGFAMRVVPFYLYRKKPLAYRILSKLLR